MYPDINWEIEPNVKLLREAYGLLTINTEKAVRLLLELADQGSVASMWYLGDVYSSGRFVPKDLAKAKNWFAKAEKAGWLPASYMLGSVSFIMGDYKAAFDDFARGAVKDHTPATYRLAIMYKEGLGTRKDAKECQRLLEVAVRKNHLFAKRDLAGLYVSGVYGAKNILLGFFMLLSLLFDLVVIAMRGGWKNPGFEDRILA